MRLSCDRTGFPIAHVEKIGLSFSLLPVTKLQFEQFLSEPSDFGDDWYEEVLAVSPRSSWRNASAAERTGLFMTGVVPLEIAPFAHWTGAHVSLPTILQWRDIDHWVGHAPYEAAVWRAAGLCKPACRILELLEEQLQPKTWGELMLLHSERREAIGNWVWWTQETPRTIAHGVLGRVPRSVGDPQKQPPFLPPSPQYRDVRFGCRLIHG